MDFAQRHRDGLTCSQTARTLGEAIGKPDLKKADFAKEFAAVYNRT